MAVRGRSGGLLSAIARAVTADGNICMHARMRRPAELHAVIRRRRSLPHVQSAVGLPAELFCEIGTVDRKA
jgi:hypothetical protein